ncbi:hypothetical protein L1987_65080 [Smallanthus sonchifolius]|uniref:Uncharacterized protein n=1 Tax=Smallanthus sonchifolius TaxID=185202 RepID=A0ACB9BTC6_9ASTR|nr:hypothetical protein L1987_65080 [Smallanthus sonchifolius]
MPRKKEPPPKPTRTIPTRSAMRDQSRSSLDEGDSVIPNQPPVDLGAVRTVEENPRVSQIVHGEENPTPIVCMEQLGLDVSEDGSSTGACGINKEISSVPSKQDQDVRVSEVTPTVVCSSPESIPGNRSVDKAVVGQPLLPTQVSTKQNVIMSKEGDQSHVIKATVIHGKLDISLHQNVEAMHNLNLITIGHGVTQLIEQEVEVNQHVTDDILSGSLGLDKDVHVHDTFKVDEDVVVNDTSEYMHVQQILNERVMWVSTSPEIHNVNREEPASDTKHEKNMNGHGQKQKDEVQQNKKKGKYRSNH